jgi:uncharacterized protein DUF5682
MGATFVGVRHHSPACARVVAATIAELRPAYVLIEGPSDMNERLDELLLGHRLPIAIFTSYQDDDRSHTSWTPFCDYSPEWVALTVGRECGAEVRFIDLPAWHEAFAGHDNRYADAELRYAQVTERLCREFAVDNVDILWDHLFEVEPEAGLAERLTAYFDALRGESETSADDAAREEYMAAWVRAAVSDAGDRPVVVVTGGFHTPAIRVLAASGSARWPEVPRAAGASYLVPYSHKRLDSFTGYQSGMPSPGYYQRVWSDGVASAAVSLVESVVARLRRRGQPVSTADLIAARTLTEGLARLRGHAELARTDVLDGLVSALVSEDLPHPVPWSRRGPLTPGTHPAVVEMVAELSGDRVGRLHAQTPVPPLVADVEAELERQRLDHTGTVSLALTDEQDLARSRTLHRLRVLAVPGFDRVGGFGSLSDPDTQESWQLRQLDHRLPALVEAGAYGIILAEAAGAALRERALDAGMAHLAAILLDAALCGVSTLSADTAARLASGVARAVDLGQLGQVLADMLALWRHDRLLGTARSEALGVVISAAVTRVLWLVEGLRGGHAPAEPGRLRAVAATRDALRHAPSVLEHDHVAVLAVARRVSADKGAPPDIRGAASGLAWSLGDDVDASMTGVDGPGVIGDWLAGLFALAREEVLSSKDLVGVLDGLVHAMSEEDFLVALPALRHAFEYFPPRDRETIARVVLEHRGVNGSARGLLRLHADPRLLAEAAALEARVEHVLAREGLA